MFRGKPLVLVTATVWGLAFWPVVTAIVVVTIVAPLVVPAASTESDRGGRADADASFGGDDFAAYTEPRRVRDTEVSVPGVYVSLGIRPRDAAYIDLHDGRLPSILDPASILVGAGGAA